MIDRLYLELSQFTTAKTQREMELEQRLVAAEAQADHVSFENEVDTQKLEQRLAAAEALLLHSHDRCLAGELLVAGMTERLTKAETLAVKRWTNEHQSALDRILQSHIDDVNKRLVEAEAAVRTETEHARIQRELVEDERAKLTAAESRIYDLRQLLETAEDLLREYTESEVIGTLIVTLRHDYTRKVIVVPDELITRAKEVVR
jgi:uncharacterized protein YeeX (DUF496 family)